jgi:hypothetical protein
MAADRNTPEAFDAVFACEDGLSSSTNNPASAPHTLS